MKLSRVGTAGISSPELAHFTMKGGGWAFIVFSGWNPEVGNPQERDLGPCVAQGLYTIN